MTVEFLFPDRERVLLVDETPELRDWQAATLSVVASDRSDRFFGKVR